MVVRNARLSDADIDGLFRALADGTRRDIVRRTLDGTASVSDLAGAYEMSFAAVQKHVAVLERAGLVRKHSRGRERLVEAAPERIAQARMVLTSLEALWRARYDQLDDVLARPAEPPRPMDDTPHPPPTPRGARRARHRRDL
jgi:DNA-binding transcriptional ArsR family regulator